MGGGWLDNNVSRLVELNRAISVARTTTLGLAREFWSPVFHLSARKLKPRA